MLLRTVPRTDGVRTDIHPDPFYKTYSSTETGSFCHRGKGAAGYYGAETSDCDTPLTLVNATFEWIAENLADSIDFVIWTGDSARHDNDEEIPRTEEQVLGQNRMLVNKFKEVFGSDGGNRRSPSVFRIPIVPTFGNNDILPHNIMVKGPNRWTRNYEDVWHDIVPEAQRHAFDRGGWFFVEVIPNKLAVISLNTMWVTIHQLVRKQCADFARRRYFFDSNSAVDGCAARTEPGYEHMEWLRIQLQFLRARGMKAIMSGHVPPARNDEKVGWDETCWQKYTLWMQQYRDVVVGAVYGHMNIEHFVLQDFRDIDIDRAAGNKPGLTAGFRGSSKSEDTKVGVLVNDGSYLQSLRRIWSKLPSVPATLIGQGVESPSGRVTQEERDYYAQIGGKYAERFAVSHMAASVVPNYFPALRVFEYNITGLEDHVVFSEDASSAGSSERWHDEEVTVGNGEEPAEEEEAELDQEDDSKLLNSPKSISWSIMDALRAFRQNKPTPTRKKKHRLIIPDPPSKHAPPGPAYSPQVLSWLGYTQYFANLTHINNDFGPGPRPEPDESISSNTNTSPNPAYDPLSHYPTTPQALSKSALSIDDPVDALRWNPGKHSDHSPKHAKPNPLNFTFEIEYDTRRVNDTYALANGSTVRAWLELATRMGEFRPRRAKSDALSMDGTGSTDEADFAGEVEDEFLDVEDDEEVDAQKKKKKHPHHDDGKDDEAREKRRRRKVAEKTWFAFASRAVVGTLSGEEIAERFGYE